MALRLLREFGDSAGVMLPKDDLRRDGLVDEDGVADATLAVDRVGECEYKVSVVELE